MAFTRQAVISVFCLLVHSCMPIHNSVTEPNTVGAQIYDEDDDDDYKELRKSERGRQRDIITRILCIHCLLVVVLLSSSVTQTDSQRCPQDAFVSNSTVNHARPSRCPSDCCPLTNFMEMDQRRTDSLRCTLALTVTK